MCKPGCTDLALTPTDVQLHEALPELRCTGRLQCRQHKARSMARERRESLKASVTLAAAGAGGKKPHTRLGSLASEASADKESIAARVTHPAFSGAVKRFDSFLTKQALLPHGCSRTARSARLCTHGPFKLQILGGSVWSAATSRSCPRFCRVSASTAQGNSWHASLVECPRQASDRGPCARSTQSKSCKGLQSWQICLQLCTRHFQGQ